jgi:hypothetical protein
MPTPIRSRQGAEMIEAAVGPVRKCSRQNLDKLCREGALLGSPCILRAKPLLLDADILLDEYLARVAPFQSEAKQPTAKRDQQATKARPTPKPKTETLPDPVDPIDGLDDDPDTEEADFNKERALHEREKRLIARMDRMEKAKELAYRADMEIAYNAVLLQLTTLASSAHKRIKAMIPHLTHQELSEIERIISEIFESVSSNEFEELPE